MTNNSVRTQLLQLQGERAALESELHELADALASNNSNMSDALVDAHGFPRNDVDVYTIRHLRNAIIRKQNDHKALMTRIESAMHAAFAEAQQAKAASASLPITTSITANLPAAFALVASVAPESPASDAGLAAGDKILRFGTASQLSAVPSQVIETVPVQVLVLRDNISVSLTLTPRKWSGSGLLGCHLINV
ncbi:26S proteasome non-ATPase regulatory subunit 9 [Physocladia obscura]|uniref:Probable 26S proteasome regulatory subunit p27 n=1 Tax=Physocladia obscura TaxID=109957 RepID=A0AAD5T8L1_9FUNG|nr:26S proteasome non-ATPase regulatory subunit 9 [Physocladia obscura]